MLETPAYQKPFLENTSTSDSAYTTTSDLVAPRSFIASSDVASGGICIKQAVFTQAVLSGGQIIYEGGEVGNLIHLFYFLNYFSLFLFRFPIYSL